MSRMPIPLSLLLAAGAVSAAAPPPVEGRWITASGNLEVAIAPCGPAWCGTVVRVIANRSMARDGDMQPVDPRPALGMTLLQDLRPDDDADPDDARVWHGALYNRENGKTYRCRVRLAGDGQLELRAYVGLPLFGKTQHWSRAPAP